MHGASPAQSNRVTPLHSRLHALLICALLVTVAVRFAEPIQDGDLFVHMAYARQMLARGTLILDHTAFSWTPAHTDVIYCAWVSELLFYGLWAHVGMASLFVFRYLVILAVVGLAYAHARRLGLARSPLTHLVVMILVLASYTGTIIKPEILSLLGMNLLVHLFFWAKLRRDQPAAAIRVLYLVPLVLVIWANCHGGFIMAAPFLIATAVGEGLNLLFSPGLALSRRTYAHLLASWALSACAIVATPYGIAYPLQLFGDLVLGHRPRPDVAWNAAHRSVIAAIGGGFYFEELFVLMAALLVILTALRFRRAPRGARFDWTILLGNLACIPLYVVYLRGTFMWPAVFAYSALQLLHVLDALPHRAASRTGFRQVLRECTVALFLFLAARSCLTAWFHPFYESWLGFGISYINPVAEAEFLAQHQLGPRLYNIFDSGGYLLWRLDPAYKVMTDSRSFPYLSWFDEQYHFTNGEDVDAFMQKYVANVAVIDLMKVDLTRWFARTPDWQLTFYGPTAAVFVRRGAPVTRDGHRVPAESLHHLRNAYTALTVFDFATNVEDFATAWEVLDQLEQRLAYQVDPKALQQALAYRDAHRALHAGDIERARSLFTRALEGKPLSNLDHTIARLFERLADPAADIGSVKAALQQLAAPG